MAIAKDPELKNLFRIDITARGGKHETHGWQFKAVRDRAQQTKFFADTVFGSKEAALSAAKTYRDEALSDIGDFVGSHISDTLPSSNTSGILGVHRSESIHKDLSIEEVWQCNAPSPDGRTKRPRAFNIATFGEKGALYRAVEARLESIADLMGAARYKSSEAAIRRLVDSYLDILIYLDSADETESNYILSVINSREVPTTDKRRVITGRVGQATYRDRLDKLWHGRCAVTGATLLLNASHIKPWALASDQERLDPFNGLLLSPVYDRAFDQGLITFEDDGRMRISSRLAADMRALSITPSASIKRLNSLSHPYLAFHREHVYKE